MEKPIVIVTRIVVPLIILAVAIVGAKLLVEGRKAPEKQEPAAQVPSVNVIEARSGDYRYTVRSQGTVTPRAETSVVAQVPGEVVWVSPAMVEGGFFAKGDVLFKIEREDYEIAVSLASEQVAQAEKQLITAEAGKVEADSRVAQTKAGKAQASSPGGKA